LTRALHRRESSVGGDALRFVFSISSDLHCVSSHRPSRYPYKARGLRDFTQEMQLTSGIFLVLLAFGLGTNLDKIWGKSLSVIADVVISYHVVPILEVVVIAYLLLRLIVEIYSIRSLLEGSETDEYFGQRKSRKGD
jgi:hypothetical protein